MNAAALRLRTAIEEYVQSVTGDTGSRRTGGIRSQVNEQDRALVEQARALLGNLGGGEGSAGNPADRDTPGARARNRVSTGGRTLELARESARTALGAGSATNGSAGAPAGGGNDQGGSP